MHETEGSGMQRLPWTLLESVEHKLAVAACALATEYFRSAVAFVAEQRVTDVFHVSPYLVCASRFENTFHEGDVAEAFQYSVVGHGRFAYL